METDFWTKIIPPTIALIFTSAFGLIVGILVEKFKNRLRIITYDIHTQNIKPNLSNNLVGNLKITLANREIDSLKTAYVELENRNNIDLEDVVVKFWLSPNAVFRGNEGYLQNNLSWLLWTPLFNNRYQDILNEFNALPIDDNGNKIIPDDLQTRINSINGHQEFLIPVFNRKDVARFNFLYEDPFDGTEANLTLSIVHKSVSLVKKTNENKQATKDLWTSIIIGFIISTILISTLIYNFPSQKVLILSASIIGILYSVFGHLVLGAFKRLKSYFR